MQLKLLKPELWTAGVVAQTIYDSAPDTDRTGNFICGHFRCGTTQTARECRIVCIKVCEQFIDARLRLRVELPCLIVRPLAFLGILVEGWACAAPKRACTQGFCNV